MSNGQYLFLSLTSTLLVAAAVITAVRWLLPAWDQLARRYVADLIPRLQALDFEEARIDWLLRAWGVSFCLVIFVVGILLSMLPIALGLCYLVFVAPRFILDYFIERRRETMRDQMVRASVQLASNVRAGLSLPQGFESLARDVPDPLGREFRRIARDFDMGRPLVEALHSVQQRLALEPFTTFATATIVCQQRGGKITEALEQISHTLQEVQRLERKMAADTASGRQMILVLGLFPLGFLAMFYIMDPVSTGSLFNTVLGQLVLLAVGALIYIAVRWALRIINIDV